MIDSPPTAVTYIGLPISSGGAHSLARMSRRMAYERTLAFLETCTEPVGSVRYSFNMPYVPELEPVPWLEMEFNRRFRHRLRVRNELVMQEEQVGNALDFLDDIDPQPTNRWGMAPIWFWLVSSFRIRDPLTRHPLPGQDPKRFRGIEYEARVPLGSSGLRLILHNHAAVGIELCIPDADDEVLRRVVPWLQQHLPFKFSPKHWRVWTPTETGSFKARRLTLPDAS